MSSPLDALHMKASAYEGMHTAAWAAWASGFVDSLHGRDPGDRSAPATETYDETGTGMTARLTRDLDLADSFYVAPQMNALVTAAAESWPADEAVWAEDFPTHEGWFWIPGGGLSALDIRGQMVHTSAVSWHITGGRALFTFWADKRHDRPDQQRQPGWDLLPQLTPWHLTHVTLGQPLARGIRMGTLLPPEVSDQIHWSTNETGNLTAFIPKGWSPAELQPHTAPEPVLAWVVSALRIMATPLVDVRRAGLPTTVRKGLAKRPHRFKNKAVTVIEFRHRVTEGDEHEGREYSHRFLRRGHWRKQWMGSETTGDRRQVRIWIHPTIVGPDDKPFLLRQHVNAFTR